MKPTGLPIEAVLAEVLHALDATGSAVLSAPPGSGKTTIVPLHLLDAPWRNDGRIVVLEPRRVATRAAARRMAHLLGVEVGGTVGYVTRDDRMVGRDTRIEVITEGVLTRRIQRDPELPGTAIVVFDELHERNLQTDLGMALALETRKALRPDLRILAMSATIDTPRIAALLGTDDRPAPIIEGAAGIHPVDVRWQPLPRKARLEPHTASVVRDALLTEPGDVLVFLPGMGEILRVRDALVEMDVAAEVMLLHGSLPAAEQDAALAPSQPGIRKVVLATDIAETSLTVEGIRVVVDSGKARAPRFDPRTGMTRLQTISISKASATQRAGRAGRIEPGVAYRLWSKLEHGARRAHIEPEITQVELAGLALELANWGARDPGDLDFLDPPPAKAYAEARKLLEMLSAVDADGAITDTGRAMARLPLHPRLAHMVVAAAEEDRGLACVIAALVDDRDVLRGHPDEVPIDLALRIRLVEDPGSRHPLAGGRGIQRARRNADDIARRATTHVVNVRPDHAGRVLALAFPDRLAMRRGSPGRFQLRTGTTAWCTNSDPLAVERFLIPADLDGKRKDARIRLAAAIDAADVAVHFSHEIREQSKLVWEGDRLIERTERKLGGVKLDIQERRPPGGPETTAAIMTRLKERRLMDLPWTPAASLLRSRVEFLRAKLGSDWPDWSLETLSDSADTWLGPRLLEPRGLGDVARIDLTRLLRSLLPYPQSAEVEQLAPTHIKVPGGRNVPVDYTGEVPVISVRVQEMYGSTRTPQVGGEPVLLQLLSPADRPVQITQDLKGFWAGSWADVRKDMAGRYPKHDWPDDPARAKPHRK
jgi:ATP-dependent helicase HrpB